MSMRRTPPLSLEGSREVIEEMRRPPEDTPERRATFVRARQMHPHVQKIFCSGSHRTSPDVVTQCACDVHPRCRRKDRAR